MKKNWFLFVLGMFFVACTTKPPAKEDVPAQEIEQPTENSGTVVLPPPTVIDTPKKADIEDRLLDSRLVKNVELGSPDSLRAAVNFIASDPKGLTDTNRLYLVIISEIMQRLYPHEPITWNVPSYQGTNKYLLAFSKLDQGVFPQNLDDSTFLSLVIPCFYSISAQVSNAAIEGKLGELETRLKKAENLSARSVLPSFLLGLMYEKTGQASKAKNAFKKAYELDSSCTQAGLNYARLLAKTGEANTALVVAEGLDNLKNTNDYKLLLGESYIGLKDYEKASEVVVGLLTANPENTAAVLLRIKILIETQEYLKANALLDAFATKDQTNKDYLLLRASLVLNWSRSTSSALTLLSQAYENYPNDFDVLLACAKICFETGQSIQGNTAENFIAKVTAKEANNAQAANLVVRNAIGNEAWGEAVSQAEKLVDLNPSQENYQLLARAYLGSRQVSKALEITQRLYNESGDKNDSITSLYLASLSKAGNISEVLRIINTRMPTASNTLKGILYFYQASISSGETKLSYLRSSLLADPRNADSLFAMYQYYYASADYKKAEYYLKQAIAIDPLNKKNTRLLQDLQKKL